MPLFSLDHFQLSQLSLAANRNPNMISPMNAINFATFADKVDQNQYNQSLDDLKRLSLIKEINNKNILAHELEPLFVLINSPQKVWRFYRESQMNQAEIYFCWYSDAAAQLSVGPAYGNYTLIYPYTLRLVEQWFVTEFISAVKPINNTLKAKRVLVDANEMLILAIMQTIYKGRITNDEQLAKRDQYINIEELTNFNEWNQLPENITKNLNSEALSYFIKYGDILPSILTTLKSKSLIEIDRKELSFTELTKQLFDPGKIRDFIQTTSFSEENSSISSLYVLDGGYLIQSPVQEKELIALTILPSDINPKELMYRLLKTKPSEIIDISKPAIKKKEPEIALKPKTVAIPVVKKQAISSDDKIICPDCGKKLNTGAKFCNSCGASTHIKPAKKHFCRECGSELKEGAAFCRNCGTKTR